MLCKSCNLDSATDDWLPQLRKTAAGFTRKSYHMLFFQCHYIIMSQSAVQALSFIRCALTFPLLWGYLYLCCTACIGARCYSTSLSLTNTYFLEQYMHLMFGAQEFRMIVVIFPYNPLQNCHHSVGYQRLISQETNLTSIV